jgi:predicted nicotinamide N-methyase
VKIAEVQFSGTGSGNWTGYIWRAAVLMLQYMEKKFSLDNIQNKKILEIGAGTGLVSLALAKAGE